MTIEETEGTANITTIMMTRFWFAVGYFFIIGVFAFFLITGIDVSAHERAGKNLSGCHMFDHQCERARQNRQLEVLRRSEWDKKYRYTKPVERRPFPDPQAMDRWDSIRCEIDRGGILSCYDIKR